jgi:hypothetical protein
MLFKLFLTYNIVVAEEEIAKADFLGFSKWWADVGLWWREQWLLFSTYLSWIMIIGSVVLIVLYGVTHERKFLNIVLVMLVVYFFWQGVKFAS